MRNIHFTDVKYSRYIAVDYVASLLNSLESKYRGRYLAQCMTIPYNYLF